MIDYTVTDDKPEDFTDAQKIRLEKPVQINGDTYEELVLAHSLGVFGGPKMALFTPDKEKELANRKLAECLREDELFFRLAKDSDNLEVQIE